MIRKQQNYFAVICRCPCFNNRNSNLFLWIIYVLEKHCEFKKKQGKEERRELLTVLWLGLLRNKGRESETGNGGEVRRKCHKSGQCYRIAQ